MLKPTPPKELENLDDGCRLKESLKRLKQTLMEDPVEHNQELAATDLRPLLNIQMQKGSTRGTKEIMQAQTKLPITILAAPKRTLNQNKPTYQTNKNKSNNQIIATSRPTQNHNPKKPTMPNNTPINPTRSSQPQSQETDTNSCILSTQLTNSSSKNIKGTTISLLKTLTPLPPSLVPFAKKNQANEAPDQPSIGDGNNHSPPPEQQPSVVFNTS
ncbi:hypothetical protein LguiA_007107 [Lonicera macranthoides]